MTTPAMKAILDARVQANDIAEALHELTPETWEEAATMLHHLRLARQALATSESVFEGLVAKLMREAGVRDAVEVEGVGTVQARRGSTRKAWDHEGLARQVLDAHLTETGELPDPYEVRDWLLEALAPSYWRVGVLKQYGLDPADYCETTPGRPTVQITTNEGALG